MRQPSRKFRQRLMINQLQKIPKSGTDPTAGRHFESSSAFSHRHGFFPSSVLLPRQIAPRDLPRGVPRVRVLAADAVHLFRPLRRAVMGEDDVLGLRKDGIGPQARSGPGRTTAALLVRICRRRTAATSPR